VHIYTLEKSDNAKNLTFCLSLFFDVYVMHHNFTCVRSTQRRSTMMCSIKWGSFSLALSQTSWIRNPNPSYWSSWSFDQRYNISLIMRKVTRLKLKFQTLFLLQCNQRSIGLTLIDSDLEKSDKVKTKFYTLFLLQCNQCSIGSTLINSDGIYWRKKEAFLWCSSNHLRSV